MMFVLFFAMAFASPKFEEKVIHLVSGDRRVKVTVEVADTDAKRQQGLMYRKELPEGRGMLFIFEREQTLSFWMKNTYIPLSIGYFDKNLQLIDIQDMEPQVSIMQTDYPRYPSKKPALYALEVPKGWFKKSRLSTGTRLVLGDPSQ